MKKTDFEIDEIDKDERITFLSDGLARAEKILRKHGHLHAADTAQKVLNGDYRSVNGWDRRSVTK